MVCDLKTLRKRDNAVCLVKRSILNATNNKLSYWVVNCAKKKERNTRIGIILQHDNHTQHTLISNEFCPLSSNTGTCQSVNLKENVANCMSTTVHLQRANTFSVRNVHEIYGDRLE